MGEASGGITTYSISAQVYVLDWMVHTMYYIVLKLDTLFAQWSNIMAHFQKLNAGFCTVV